MFLLVVCTRNLPLTFDTGAYMTYVDISALSRAGYDVNSGKFTYKDEAAISTA